MTHIDQTIVEGLSGGWGWYEPVICPQSRIGPFRPGRDLGVYRKVKNRADSRKMCLNSIDKDAILKTATGIETET